MPLVGVACLAPLVWVMPAVAQEEDLGALIGKAMDAMKAEQWQEALALNTRALERFGAGNPLQTYGGQFGAIHFHKGTCEMKLKRWDEAMKSFETCYRDFPDTGPEGGNVFQKMALLKRGEAAMGAGNWELAISQFRKFLKERDKARDKYPQGAFHIGMAICQYHCGRIPEGNESLEIAIRNKHGFPTPESGIVAAFQALVATAIGSRDEQVLLDFIGKNRGGLVIEPYEMHRLSQVFLKLASDAAGAGMPRAAFGIYQFVPSTDAAIEDVKARLRALGPMERVTDGGVVFIRKDLEADLAALEAERRGKSSPEMLKLAGTALLHEQNGNPRGAYAAWCQLELYHPASGTREENLFNLVRTSVVAAAAADTRRWAGDFLAAFPESSRATAVRGMLLSRLYQDGDFKACVETARPMLDKLAADAPERDFCLHVLGASLFRTGQFEKARPLLDEHAEKYPKSPDAVSTAYLRAVNAARLGDRTAAGALLDGFLQAYPDPRGNIHLADALYERAACDFAEERMPEALAALERITTGFPDGSLAARAWNLTGNALRTLGEMDKAEAAWLKGLKIAEESKDGPLAAEMLCSLVSLSVNEKAGSRRLKDSAALADRFWKDHADGSPDRARVAIDQVSALESANRAEDALKRLQEMIRELAASPRTRELDALIRAHTAAYLRKHDPEELARFYQNFPGIAAENTAVRTRLRVAVIGAFENLGESASDETARNAAAARSRALYQELKTEFAMKDLANFMLVRIGDHLRLSTATPREALPYYDEVIGREDPSCRFAALLGRADVWSHSGSKAETDKAVADLNRVLAESKDEAELNYAKSRIAEIRKEESANP